MVCHGLGSPTPQVGELSQGEPKRSGSAGEARHHCWGRREDKGKMATGISFLVHAWTLRGQGTSGAAMGGESQLA